MGERVSRQGKRGRVPKEYKRKAIFLSVGLFLAYAGMWSILAVAEERVRAVDKYVRVIGIGSLIYHNIKYLLAGLIIALLPYERLMGETRDAFCYWRRAKQKHSRLWPVAGLAAAHILAGLVFKVFAGNERAPVLLFGLWLLTGIYVFEWIEDSRKCWIAEMALAIFDACLIVCIASFMFAFVAYEVMLAFYVVYSMVRKGKFNRYLSFCSVSFGCMVFFLIGPGIQVTGLLGRIIEEGLNPESYAVSYIDGLFRANKLEGWIGVCDHPFTMIYSYIGLYPFLAFIGLFLIGIVLAVLSCKYVLNYSVKRCGFTMGIYGLFAATYIHALMVDVGVPMWPISILRNYVDFISLALVFRSLVLIPVLPAKERETPDSVLLWRKFCVLMQKEPAFPENRQNRQEEENLRLLTERVSALCESQENLLKRLSAQEDRIDKLERQLLRQSRNQRPGHRGLLSGGRKYIRISGKDSDDG